MKRLILFAIVFIAAILLGLQLQTDPGYVLLSYQKYTVEMPLWFGIILLALLNVAIIGFIKFIRWLFSCRKRFRAWRAYRLDRRAAEYSQAGLLALAEGRFKKAEKYCLKAASQQHNVLLNTLAAARAAQEQHALDRRDKYLQMAHRSATQNELSLGLSRAELHMRAGESMLALESLQHLHRTAPKHAHVVKLLMTIYQDTQDHQNLRLLLPDIKKLKVLTDEDYAALEQKVAIGCLQQESLQNTSERLQQCFTELPKNCQKDPNILAVYIQALLKFDEAQTAHDLLKAYLKRAWDEQLVYLFGLAVGDNPKKQLQMAEYWLKIHPENAALFLTLGRLCIANQLWGKAKDYFNLSLTLKPQAETYYALAKLSMQINDTKRAQHYYQRGMEWVMSRHSA